jgi:hypothetical protein
LREAKRPHGVSACVSLKIEAWISGQKPWLQSLKPRTAKRRPRTPVCSPG